MAGLDKLEANWAVRELKTTKVHMKNLIKSKKRIVFSEDLPAIEEYFNFAALNCEVESYSQRQSLKNYSLPFMLCAIKAYLCIKLLIYSIKVDSA